MYYVEKLNVFFDSISVFFKIGNISLINNLLLYFFLGKIIKEENKWIIIVKRKKKVL